MKTLFAVQQKILYEEYDPVEDEVALPFTLDPSEEMSVESSSKYENDYAFEDYHLNPCEDNYYASYNVNMKKGTKNPKIMSSTPDLMKQTISGLKQKLLGELSAKSSTRQPILSRNKTFSSVIQYAKTYARRDLG